jgi:hypothetical protein
MGHTPGPWTVGDVQWIMNQKSGMGYSYRPITAGSWELATVWEDDSDQEMAANVRLISAAPDLLAALKVAAEFISGHNECLSMPSGSGDRQWNDYCIGLLEDCKAAITKAEGRSE